MGDRDAGSGMHFSRVRCSDPEVAVFGISGSLGPSARPFLVRLTQECLRRGLPRLVLDLSGIESMGGGTARLLNEFADHVGSVLSRDYLLERVWGYEYLGDSRLVDAHVRRLRVKIEDQPDDPKIILTVRGLGYRLVA